MGEAIDVLRALDRAGERFDIAFIDVDKARIREYFELALDPGVEVAMLPVADGLTLVRRRAR